MKLDAAVMFIILMLAAVAVAAAAFDAADCAGTGGQLAKGPFGGLTCVGGKP